MCVFIPVPPWILSDRDAKAKQHYQRRSQTRTKREQISTGGSLRARRSTSLLKCLRWLFSSGHTLTCLLLSSGMDLCGVLCVTGCIAVAGWSSACTCLRFFVSWPWHTSCGRFTMEHLSLDLFSWNTVIRMSSKHCDCTANITKLFVHEYKTFRCHRSSLSSEMLHFISCVCIKMPQTPFSVTLFLL